jgi:hypothetical protein
VQLVSLWSLLVELDSGGEVLKPALVCGLLEQVCVQLEELHAAGRAHGALSPSCMAVTARGEVVLGDGDGSPVYWAPEQVVGSAPTPRSDVFALGLVLHDLARGMRPMHDRIGALAEVTLDGLALPLHEIVRGAIATAPRERFASASELGAALRDAGDAWGGSFARPDIAAWLAARRARRAASDHDVIATAARVSRTSIVVVRRSRLPYLLGLSALVAFVAMVITAAIPTGLSAILDHAQQQPAHRPGELREPAHHRDARP